MEQKHFILSVLILGLIVLGMFVFTVIKKQEIVSEQNTPPPIAEEERSSKFNYIEQITARHFYLDGVHTLVGEIDMPTPCDLLEWDVLVMESYPEQVIVDFSVINHSDMCTQVITPQQFSVSFNASDMASIRVRLEGEEIDLNLVPATEDESPEGLEPYIKR